MVKLDGKDKLILRELQKDSRQSIKRISKKLNMPITTIHFRLKKLEESGVIKQYTAILDSNKIGKPVTAYVFLTTQHYIPSKSKAISIQDIAENASKLPGVQEVKALTGVYDVLLKVRLSESTELGDFIINRIRKLEGVNASQTAIVLSTVKETTIIDL